MQKLISEMKKFITRMAVLLVSALALVGCDLDKPQNYTFDYSLIYSVAEEDTQKAVEEYFKAKIDFDKNFSIYAGQYEAAQQATDIFLEDVEAINHDEVLAIIGEDDVVELALNMYSPKGKVGVAGAIYWYHSDDEEDSGAKE